MSTTRPTTPASSGSPSKDTVGPASPWSSTVSKWLVKTGETMKTADGKTIEVWELRHKNDEPLLSAWAKHFRNQYCDDAALDFLRGKRSRKDFLENIKFPSRDTSLGPGVRAGDFGEILVADYLEWILGYWVPRVRWNAKVVRDESSKGSDVIGFQFHDNTENSPKDALAVFETKTRFSGTGAGTRLQDAIDDSAKDHIRVAESLNYIKQRLFDKGETKKAKQVERFQNPVDQPYRKVYGAAALYSHDQFKAAEICKADCEKIQTSANGATPQPHPNRNALVLIVIKGTDMMSLVHDLYRRAADEA